MSYIFESTKAFKKEFARKHKNVASSGEKKVSFIIHFYALHILWFGFKLIISVPFTVIDPNVVLKVLATLKELPANSQIFILATKCDTNIVQMGFVTKSVYRIHRVYLRFQMKYTTLRLRSFNVLSPDMLIIFML